MSRKSKNKARLQLEQLEDRSLMTTGLTASLANGVLRITGTEQADAIVMRQINNRLSVSGLTTSYDVSGVRQIVVDGRGGNDAIRLDTGTRAGEQPILLPARLFGGAGNDLVAGGHGADLLSGGVGIDRLYGMNGNDLLDGIDDVNAIDRLYGGFGDDRLFGENGRDILDGGFGVNQLERRAAATTGTATVLDWDIGATDDLIKVANGQAFPSKTYPFNIKVDGEVMKVTGHYYGNYWTVERGQFGTKAQAHANRVGITPYLSQADFTGGQPSLTVLVAPKALQAAVQSDTTLLHPIDANRTSLPINGGTGFPLQTPFHIKIDNEIMKVVSRFIGDWTVERGAAGTTRQAHAAGAAITLVDPSGLGQGGQTGQCGPTGQCGQGDGQNGQDGEDPVPPGDGRCDLVPPAIISPIGTAGSTTPTFVWTPVQFALRYEIFVQDPTGSKVLNPTDIPGRDTTWTASSALVPGTTYTWMVRAIVDPDFVEDANFDNGDCTIFPWSEMKTFQVTGSSAGTAPFAPTIRSYVQHNKTDLTLEWSNVAGEDGYAVDYWTGTDWKEIARTGANVTTLTINGGIGFYFRVGAYNGAGANYSKYLFAADGGGGTVGGSTGGATGVISAPTGLRYSPTNVTDGILNWSNVDAESSYVIEYWNGNGWVQFATTPADITTLSVTNGAGLYLRVGAVPPSGVVSDTIYSDHTLATRGDAGNVGSGNTLATPKPPAVPTGLRWSAGAGNDGTLFWDNVAGETGYVIEYWNDTAWSQFATTGADVNSLFVTSGAGRFLRIGAFNAVGTTFSEHILADAGTGGATGGGNTGNNSAPSQPMQPKWSPSVGNDGNLSWTNASGETSYVIEYWNNTSWIQIASVGADITTLFLTNGTGNFLRVGAKNSFGTTYSEHILASS